MRLQGKDRDANLQLLEAAHKAGKGDTRAVARHYLAGLDELAGLGIGWARDIIDSCKVTGAMARTRDHRRRSFLPGRTNRRRRPLRVPAYIGAQPMVTMPLGAVIASAASDEAMAYTLLAIAKEKRRLVSEAEAAGRRSIGRRAA